MKEIATGIKENPTAQTYYEAARYLQEQGELYRRPCLYLNKAIEIGGDTYYFYRVKSLVEAALEDYGSAIISAQKSLELAQKEDKDEFVRMNEQNISRLARETSQNQNNEKTNFLSWTFINYFLQGI